MRDSLFMIRVRSRPGSRTRGWLVAAGVIIPVALGRTGIRADKREGDGATPAGRFRPRRLWWRADRGPRPRSPLPIRRIRSDDAWSEDPRERGYNRPFRLGPADAGDRLWRSDHLYDLIVEIDHNTRPRVAGRGSAVFLHVARSGLASTAGCVAMTAGRLRWLVARLGPKTRILIQ
jgi:L,D-peptidoglycan transpeptidase YkuD (ErfK/YbiS/YcfS/YnhG family)